MKIKIVCSGNTPDFDFKKHQAFIYDQVEAVKNLDTEIKFDYFFISGKGWKGYLSEFKRLKREINQHPCDIIHAHFGLACFLASLQRRVPVVSTFHGSDINHRVVRWLSGIASMLSSASVFVSKKLMEKALVAKNPFIIPCGVDLSLFKPIDKDTCRKTLKLEKNKKYLLFSSAFTNPVKNYQLLKTALENWGDSPPEVLELWNRSREEVPLWMNAADICVLTSISEGSPQFIKESLACNRPVIATDVGDISEVFQGVDNAIIVNFEAPSVQTAIRKLLPENKSNGRSKMTHFDHLQTARKIIAVYKSLKQS
jgi:glycosyltransferase involved in cell wall biosynthesis